ncbi:hypothetical protein GKC56_00020 [Neisseriaceae bacterium PsAf]|nr:hypothetical protein [Neisseriaceae bacterium PsAf]
MALIKVISFLVMFIVSFFPIIFAEKLVSKDGLVDPIEYLILNFNLIKNENKNHQLELLFWDDQSTYAQKILSENKNRRYSVVIPFSDSDYYYVFLCENKKSDCIKLEDMRNQSPIILPKNEVMRILPFYPKG